MRRRDLRPVGAAALALWLAFSLALCIALVKRAAPSPAEHAETTRPVDVAARLAGDRRFHEATLSPIAGDRHPTGATAWL
jgi:hypothetical protein